MIVLDTRDRRVRACRAAGFEPQLVSLTREQFAIRSTVMSGAAVTLAPQLLVDAFAGTALRPIDGPPPVRDVYVLVPAGAPPSAGRAAGAVAVGGRAAAAPAA
jgi:DNA-binding transcriptional LysR family regulator